MRFPADRIVESDILRRLDMVSSIVNGSNESTETTTYLSSQHVLEYSGEYMIITG